MPRRILLFLVPLLTVAIVALGLRVGAKDEVEAGIVHGAPLPRGGGRLAWSLATFREASGVREVWSTPYHATFRAKGTSVTLDGETNSDGIAELDATLPGLAPGDPIAIDVRDGFGNVLVAGDVHWSEECSGMGPPNRGEHRELVHPTSREGELDVKVAVWGARISTASAGTLWISADDHNGKPAHLVRAEVESDPGLTVLDPLRLACGDTIGTLRVVPNMHVAPLDLRVTDDHGRTGRFFGALPTAPGALFVDLPPRAPVGPVSFTITAPATRTIAYVEIDDDVGRVFGSVVTLSAGRRGDEAPSATVTTPPLAEGLHWVVVSGEPDGAETMAGTTRAFPLRIGALASDACDEAYAGRTPTALPRFVAVDGFARARIPAAARRATGRKIVLGAVGAGLLLELLLLVTAIRRARPAIPSSDDDDDDANDGEDGPAPTKAVPTSRAESAIVLLLLSALGFLLLFALLESQTR